MGNVNSNLFPGLNNLLLPPELVDSILEFVSPRDLLIARQVCKSWKQFIDRTGVFKDTTVVLDSTDEILNQIDHDHVNPWVFQSLSCYNVEILSSSIGFWVRYGGYIQELKLIKSSILHTPMSMTPSLPSRKCLTEQPHSESSEESNVWCPNLEKLMLRSCDRYFLMGGKFLNIGSVMNLGRLTQLNLSYNRFEPRNLNLFSDFYHSYINDYILFAILDRTSHLQSLNLSGCSFAFSDALFRRFYPDIAPKREERPENFEYSDAILSYHMLVTDFIFSPKGNSLSKIYFNDTNITGPKLLLISDSEKFRWAAVGLKNCPEVSTRDLMIFLNSQPYITELNLGKTKLTSENFEQLNLQCLRDLDISGARNVKSLEFIKKCECLRTLNAQDCDDASFFHGHFRSLQNLTSLTLSGVVPQYLPYETEMIRSAIANVIAELPTLKVLDISDLGNVVNDGLIQSIIRLLPHLISLNIARSTITDAGLLGMPQSYYQQMFKVKKETQSEREDMYWHWPVAVEEEEVEIHKIKWSFEGYYPISRLKKLKKLDLSSCNELRTCSFQFAVRLPNLTHLYINGNQHINWKTLQYIAQNCPILEEIRCMSCHHDLLNDDFAEGLKKALPRLRKLMISTSSLFNGL